MKKNIILLTETILIYFFAGFLHYSIINTSVGNNLKYIVLFPVLLFQGLWFYRIYIVGHEASHYKLFKSKKQNDFWGSLILLPLMTPINIYRKIHFFHHGFNRKDHKTSALDTFVLKGKPTLLKKMYCYLIWYLSVFFGGFFIHSLISVLLFLFIPPRFSAQISPAFNNWKNKDQVTAILLFILGIGFHFSVYYFMGLKIYLSFLGFPLLSFAWVLSLLVYLFHYNTTKGDPVKFNVRAVKRIPVVSWILMNFNEHATHHQNQSIPWYELPQKRIELPEEYDKINQKTTNFFKAIINQLNGPIIIYEPDN